MRVTTGDPRGGIVDLRAFLASNPNHEQAPTARRLVAQALGKYGDREDLAEAYKALMEQDPPTAEALLRRRGDRRPPGPDRRIRRRPGRSFGPSSRTTR